MLLIKDLGTCQISGLEIQTFLHCSLRKIKNPKPKKQKTNLQQLLTQKNYVFVTLLQIKIGWGDFAYIF